MGQAVVASPAARAVSGRGPSAGDHPDWESVGTGAGRMGKQDNRTVQWLIGMEVSSDLSVKFLEDHPILGGGNSNIFLMFIPKIGEDSHFDEYFSDGLKPPTSIYTWIWTRCL